MQVPSGIVLYCSIGNSKLGGSILADNFLPKSVPLQDAILELNVRHRIYNYSAWDSEQK